MTLSSSVSRWRGSLRRSEKLHRVEFLPSAKTINEEIFAPWRAQKKGGGEIVTGFERKGTSPDLEEGSSPRSCLRATK